MQTGKVNLIDNQPLIYQNRNKKTGNISSIFPVVVEKGGNMSNFFVEDLERFENYF